MSNSLLLTKSIHPDQTTEKEKQYHSALGNFLPERAAGFNSFCCLMGCRVCKGMSDSGIRAELLALTFQCLGHSARSGYE